jgi:hypothetical protein
MWWAFVVISLVSMPFSVEMARERNRSPRVWFWIAFLTGPIAPFVLFLLGQAKRSVPV